MQKGLLVILCVILGYVTARARSYAHQGELDQHKEVALRMIGHQLLLAAGDSTSRVLPVQRDFNKYIISFADSLYIYPDELNGIVQDVVDDSELSASFIIEVMKCQTDEVVYAYEVSSSDTGDLVPCLGRELPWGCYVLHFTETSFTEDQIQTSNDEPAGGASGWWIALLAALVLGGTAFLIRTRKQPKHLSDPNLIQLGKYRFDTIKSELIIEEQRIELTTKESDLLMLLYENKH